MRRFLRIMAAGQLLLGGMIAISVCGSAVWDVVSGGARSGLVMTALVSITASLAAMLPGAVLLLLIRLAYQPKTSETAAGAAAPVEPSRPRARWRGMAGILDTLALMQMIVGPVAFGIADYVWIISPDRQSKESNAFSLLGLTLLCWTISSVGGILWALTRLAYPPTPRS